MMYLDLDELPDVFAGRWLWRLRAARARRLPPRRLSRRRAAAAGRRGARSGRSAHRPPAARARSGCSPTCATPATAFNPVTSTTAGTAPSRRRGDRRRDHQHPVGRAPRLRVSARASTRRRRQLRFRFAKDFHVSPFMAMDHEYRLALPHPGERLAVHMENRAPAGRALRRHAEPAAPASSPPPRWRDAACAIR